MKLTLFLAATLLAMLALGFGVWALNDVPHNTTMLKNPDRVILELLMGLTVVIVTTGWFWRARAGGRWAVWGVSLASSAWLLRVAVGLLLT
jgi:hypothetical protein